ncbi:hypothetical protein [Mesorhizobium sp. M0768]|uniref:hypothetical protein n=1 Tax=Mesorhizobium sp. M0768 TaxID=2956996 RepID=UPI00333AF1FE
MDCTPWVRHKKGNSSPQGGLIGKEDLGRRFQSRVEACRGAAHAWRKLSRELGESRKGFYQWQKQFRVDGSSALRGAGRQRVEAVRLQANDPAVPAPSDTSDELSQALARIADLELLVGQKTVDLDFSASLAARRGRTPAERRA